MMHIKPEKLEEDFRLDHPDVRFVGFKVPAEYFDLFPKHWVKPIPAHISGGDVECFVVDMENELTSQVFHITLSE